MSSRGSKMLTCLNPHWRYTCGSKQNPQRTMTTRTRFGSSKFKLLAVVSIKHDATIAHAALRFRLFQRFYDRHYGILLAAANLSATHAFLHTSTTTGRFIVLSQCPTIHVSSGLAYAPVASEPIAFQPLFQRNQTTKTAMANGLRWDSALVMTAPSMVAFPMIFTTHIILGQILSTPSFVIVIFTTRNQQSIK